MLDSACHWMIWFGVARHERVQSWTADRCGQLRAQQGSRGSGIVMGPYSTCFKQCNVVCSV